MRSPCSEEAQASYVEGLGERDTGAALSVLAIPVLVIGLEEEGILNTPLSNISLYIYTTVFVFIHLSMDI